MNFLLLRICITAVVIFSAFCISPCPGCSQELFSENFEDKNFTARGWISNPGIRLSSTEYHQGIKSAEYRFLPGNQLPDYDGNGSFMRRLFSPASEQVYISFWIKFDTSWQTTGERLYFYLLTNKDDAFANPKMSYLTFYFEENNGVVHSAISDSKNINTDSGLFTPDSDTPIPTEERAVAGCNGSSDAYPRGICIQLTPPQNAKKWSLNYSFSLSVTTWHHVELFVQLNKNNGSGALANGKILFGVDGVQHYALSDMVFRTDRNEFRDMAFNQFVIGPYIYGQLSVEQTFWMDGLVVATEPPADSPVLPSELSPPQIPTNIHIIDQ